MLGNQREIMNEFILHQVQSTNQHQQAQVLEYFELLKSQPDGWEQCAAALLTSQYAGNEQIQFFCYQVIEHFLKNSYSNVQDRSIREKVRSFVINHIQQFMSEQPEKSFIRNKFSQLVSLVLVSDYPSVWPTFYSDLISLGLGSLRGADIYLRILKAIDAEVVDREVVHSPEVQRRNQNIKDCMREQCVPQLVDSWYTIMTEYQISEPSIVCSCLDVVGLFVSWIDIGLIANDKVVCLLLRFLRMDLLRESACDCVTEIVHKGMDPEAKIKLIESFTTVLQSEGVIYPEQDEEGDFVQKLARLVNEMGDNLHLAWTTSVKSSAPTAASTASLALASIESKISLLSRFLSDEDDDVSLTVSPFALNYINILKQVKTISAAQRQYVQDILMIVVRKLEYDKDYDFVEEGEDEAMFQDYRKQIKLVFNAIAKLDSEMILITVHKLLSERLDNWRAVDFRQTEVALHLVYSLGEALPMSDSYTSLINHVNYFTLNNNLHGYRVKAAHNQHFKGDPTKANALQQMLKMIVESGVSQHKHQAVVLQYFETITRYEKFFQLETSCIQEVLASYLDERGLRNPSTAVRSRASYLFTRFVRSTRSQLVQYTDTILQRMQGLLVLDTPNGLAQWLTNDEKMFLYEVASQLIVSSDIAAETKAEMMTALLKPIVVKFNLIYEKLCAEQDENAQAMYADCLVCAMNFANRSSKGFTMQLTMKSCNCIDIFTSCLERFIQTLNAPYQRTILQQGVRQFFHRMVVCLEDAVLPFVPTMVRLMLEAPDPKELYDFIPMLNQLTTKFKKTLEPFLNEAFVPLVSCIFAVLSTPTDERDTVTRNDLKMLRRGYFTFISSIVNSDLTDVIRNLDPEYLEQVLVTIIQGASEIPDPSAQKTCFAILKKLIEVWGGKDGLNGFDAYTRERIIPACFNAPTMDTFDWSDAQTMLLLGNISSCVKAAFVKQSAELTTWLKSSFFPNLRVAPSISNDFCDALSTSGEDRKFKEYFKTFYENARNNTNSLNYH